MVRSGDNKADVTFFISDAGKAISASSVTTAMNRLETSEMTLITAPYAVSHVLLI